MAKIVLGIDVSKRTLDVALIFDNRVLSKQFKNSLEGFKVLAAWLASLQITRVHACLEATGTYSEGVALFLHNQGHLVSVVNPLRIKGYAAANMQRNKTDRLDARLIAAFCLTQEPDEWQPPSYLDADIIEYFKNAGQEAKEGYQTLINRTLREVIKGGQHRNLQADLLNDRHFLAELKTKLETV